MESATIVMESFMWFRSLFSSAKTRPARALSRCAWPQATGSKQAETDMSDTDWDDIAAGFNRFLKLGQQHAFEWLEEMAKCDRG
jgi:hypothetical protein